MADSSHSSRNVHADRLGTPETVSDATQSFVLQESYTPFGLATVSGPETLFVRAPGQFFEPESGPPGLYQNGAREYYPALGRYIESDPIGLAGGINTYAYANGNPVNNTDPLGLFAGLGLPPPAPPTPNGGSSDCLSNGGNATPPAPTILDGSGSSQSPIQLADIASSLQSLGGGIPTLVPTPKGATQFIFPNGMILRFDLAPGQYLSGQGPHINLEVPGGNIHIPLRP